MKRKDKVQIILLLAFLIILLTACVTVVITECNKSKEKLEIAGYRDMTFDTDLVLFDTVIYANSRIENNMRYIPIEIT